MRSLEQLSDARATTVAFGTEAPYFHQLGAETVVFGPGDMQVAHRAGEYIVLEELERGKEILVDLIHRMTGRNA